MDRKTLGSLITTVALIGILVLWNLAEGDDEYARPAGVTITLTIGGAEVSFPDVFLTHEHFLGETWIVELDGMEGERTTFSMGFMTGLASPEEIEGETLHTNYASDNPERRLSEDIWNWFRHDGIHYQGHDVRLTIIQVLADRVSVEVEATYLLFENNEAWETEGTEVAVHGTFTLPLIDE